MGYIFLPLFLSSDWSGMHRDGPDVFVSVRVWASGFWSQTVIRRLAQWIQIWMEWLLIEPNNKVYTETYIAMLAMLWNFFHACRGHRNHILSAVETEHQISAKMSKKCSTHLRPFDFSWKICSGAGRHLCDQVCGTHPGFNAGCSITRWLSRLVSSHSFSF